MGKASSAKKVARAARAGGSRRPGQRRALGFPVIITAVVVLGVGLVVLRPQQPGRQRRAPLAGRRRRRPALARRLRRSASAASSSYDDRGHGLVQTSARTPLGIHTHGDGVIHIHPFLDSAGGRNARLQIFFDDVNLEVVGLERSRSPTARSWDEDEDTCTTSTARRSPARSSSPSGTTPRTPPTASGRTRSITDDFGDIRFRNDREYYTIAFVPEGELEDIPVRAGHHRRPQQPLRRRPGGPRGADTRRAEQHDADDGGADGLDDRPADGRPRRRRDAGSTTATTAAPRRVRAVVLVGGFGTRLRPLTLSTPKQMLPVVDRPMIEWVLAGLARHGVDDAVLSLGYRPDAFAAAYPDGVCAGVRLHYAVEPEPLDTAGAVRFAAVDAGIDERFVVVNGDVLTDLDLTALVAAHDAAGAEGTIALHRVEDPSAFGVVPDRSRRPGHRLRREAASRRGAHRPHQRRHLRARAVRCSTASSGGRRVSIEREVFPAMVDDGALYAFDDERRVLDRHRHAAAVPDRHARHRRGPSPDGLGPACRRRPPTGRS